MKHQASGSFQPLFFKAGRNPRTKLTLWRLLKSLCKEVDLDEAERMTDVEFGRLVRRAFPTGISQIARSDLPKIDPSTSIQTSFYSRDYTLRSLPVCDQSNRLTGMVSSTGLLRGISEALNLEPEEELPELESN